MWKRLNMEGVKASQQSVRLALRFIDENAVNIRKRRRLRRRSYANPGANVCWHIDGYDKLKPYSFAIHGAIDGFSRKIIWLNVGSTNNNPHVVAHYVVRAIFKLNQIPCTVRGDRGTENIHVARMQRFLRRDGEDAF